MVVTQTHIKTLCQNPDHQYLFKCMKKMYQAQNQHSYMEECRLKNLIPLGISEQCKFSLSYSNPELTILINSMFQITKSRVFDLLIHEQLSIFKKHRTLFYSQINFLKQKYSLEQVNNLLNDFNFYLINISNKTKETHQKKIRNLEKHCNDHLYYPTDIQFNLVPIPSSNGKKNRKFNKKEKKKKPRMNRRQVTNSQIRGDKAVPVNDRMILNLTTFELKQDHKEVLTLGPNFAPTPTRPNVCKRDDDIDNWVNKIRWAHFFSLPCNKTNGEPNPHQNIEQKLVPASGRKAPTSKSQALELYLSLTLEDLKKTGLVCKSFDNMSINHRKALKELQSWDGVFRYFDKGTGWVMDTKESYEQRVHEHLRDTNTFQAINSPEDTSPIPKKISDINNKIKAWAEKFLDTGDISKKIAKWVVKNDSRPGYNYVNYKAHKPQANYPGRLITSCCGSPTQNLAEYSDFYLQEISKKLPYVVKDNAAFLFEIYKFNLTYEGSFENILLVSFDIVAMFPSLDNEMGLNACKDLLDKRQTCYPSTDCILEATRITLENILSIFNKVAYLQTKGTAMGPGNACSLFICRHSFSPH